MFKWAKGDKEGWRLSMPKCLACKRATQPPTLPYDFSSDEDDELSDVESSDEEEEGA
jgi:hypothetical protein